MSVKEKTACEVKALEQVAKEGTIPPDTPKSTLRELLAKGFVRKGVKKPLTITEKGSQELYNRIKETPVTFIGNGLSIYLFGKRFGNQEKQ
jgi:predicted transcriptional regulator